MEFSAGGGALRFPPFVVSSDEENFEGSSIFLLCVGRCFQALQCIKKIGMIDNLKGDTEDLF